MNVKKTVPALALIAVMLFIAATAMAQTNKEKRNNQAATPQAAQISQEDQAAIKALWKEHQQKIQPLRDQLWAKQMEYDALTANQNSKHQDIKAIIEDMSKLRVQIRTERANFQDELEAKGFNRGHNRHFAGFGEGGYNCSKQFKGHQAPWRAKGHGHHDFSGEGSIE